MYKTFRYKKGGCIEVVLLATAGARNIDRA
jgi:hypothetical protein